MKDTFIWPVVALIVAIVMFFSGSLLKNKENNITINLNKIEAKNEKTEIEEKIREDLSVETAQIIIDEYKKILNVEPFDEMIRDFILSDKYHIATKTQLLSFFIPEYNKKVEEYLPEFYTAYDEILTMESDNYLLLDSNRAIITDRTEELLKNIEKNHLIIIKQVSQDKIMLTLDWAYFIETYSDYIDPYFVEIMALYEEQSKNEIRDMSGKVDYGLVVTRIMKNEELLGRAENDLYTQNIVQNLLPYYSIFFGEGEKLLFNDVNELKTDYLRIFNQVLTDHPKSELSTIIVKYLNLLKEGNKFVKNSFSTVYIREQISGEVSYYEFDEKGNLVN